jgi:thiamine biosynthesis protein ThiS
MKITINGKQKEIEYPKTLWDITSDSFRKSKEVIVLHNDKICGIQEQKDILIKNNDRIEFVQLIGGG